MFTNREDLAWAAGFFDGEGCFYARKQHGKYYATMETDQVDPEVLAKCQRITGLGKVKGPYKQGNVKHQDQWRWQTLGFAHTQALVAMLWTWLGTKKRNQATRVLQLHGKPHE